MKHKLLFPFMLSVSMLFVPLAQAEQPTAEFKPPQLGAPIDRVGGGTRDISKLLNKALTAGHIQLLASRKTGLTSSASPTLYWHTATIPTESMELTIQTEGKTILKKTLDAIKTAGLQKIQLTNYGVKLIEGQDYIWSISTSKESLVQTGATIRYQQSSTASTNIEDMINAGYWYDAVNQLINSNSPKLNEFLKQEGINIGEEE